MVQRGLGVLPNQGGARRAENIRGSIRSGVAGHHKFMLVLSLQTFLGKQRSKTRRAIKNRHVGGFQRQM